MSGFGFLAQIHADCVERAAARVLQWNVP